MLLCVRQVRAHERPFSISHRDQARTGHQRARLREVLGQTAGTGRTCRPQWMQCVHRRSTLLGLQEGTREAFPRSVDLSAWRGCGQARWDFSWRPTVLLIPVSIAHWQPNAASQYPTSGRHLGSRRTKQIRPALGFSNQSELAVHLPLDVRCSRRSPGGSQSMWRPMVIRVSVCLC